MDAPFLGSAYKARSSNLADNRAINIYLDIVTKEGAGKTPAGFYGCPGLDLLQTLATDPVRGLHAVQDTLYALAGDTLYALTTEYIVTTLGTVASNSGPVSFIDNGLQVALFDGIGGWSVVVASGVMAPIALPFAGPVSANYQDGLGFVNQSGTDNWWQSDLFNLTVWGPLNFSSADAKPDFVLAIGDLHRLVYLFKQEHTEVWINAGLPGFAFQRLEGVFIEVGIAAPFSLAKAGGALVWLTRGPEGQGQIVQASGYDPKPISTPAIEYAIAQYPIISDAVAYSYLQEGHLFYIITFPSGNETWGYDGSTGEWHQRAAFSQGEFSRHWSNCYAFFNGQHVVGDYSSGNLYAFNLDTYLDNGVQRKWLRSWRAFAKPVFEPVEFPCLTINMETGIGVPDGTNPQVMMRYTDDGGHNFSKEWFAAAGETGQTAKRVQFKRLGSTRRATGLDRCFELSSTDPFKVALLGAELGEGD